MERNNFNPPLVNWRMDLTDLPSCFSVQQMREAEYIGWKGGENFFDGKHDEFCFVCGGNMQLFSCQTCENCYHAACMSPTLEPSDVPTFWFCPHCVDRQLHIPPGTPTTHYFTPVSPAPPFPSPSSPISSRTRRGDTVSPIRNPTSSLSRKRPAHPSNLEEQVRGSHGQVTPDRNANTQSPSQMAEARSANTSALTGSNSRSRRSHSPPRKKSKYSAFSIDVDKALTVIHKELEKASQLGRSDGGLQDKIQALEQQLKLKDGQIQLGIKEIEYAKREHGELGLLEAENKQLKAQNAKLAILLERKDAELKDWRSKLRTLIGNNSR